MWCKHNWKEIARTYCSPAQHAWGSATPEMWDRVTHGQTTILWECQKCKKLRREEMLGKII